MAQTDKKETLEPNIMFIGKTERHGKTVSLQPPASMMDGGVRITMPEAEEQLNGFYHKDAARIINAFPLLYKKFVQKGAK